MALLSYTIIGNEIMFFLDLVILKRLIILSKSYETKYKQKD